MDKKLRNLRHNIKEELDNKVIIDKISLDHSLEEHREEIKSKRPKLAYILTPVLVVLLIALIIPIGIINNSNANGGEQVPSNPQTPGETDKGDGGIPGDDNTYNQESFITSYLKSDTQEKLIIKNVNEFESKFNNIINNDLTNSNKLSKYNEEFFNDNDLVYINVDEDYLISNILNMVIVIENEVSITLNRESDFKNNQKMGIILVTIPKEKHIEKISICLK